jgi:hypothetical protein
MGRHDAGGDHGHDQVGLATGPRRAGSQVEPALARSTANLSPCDLEATIWKRSPASTNALPRRPRRTMSTKTSADARGCRKRFARSLGLVPILRGTSQTP